MASVTETAGVDGPLACPEVRLRHPFSVHYPEMAERNGTDRGCGSVVLVYALSAPSNEVV